MVSSFHGTSWKGLSNLTEEKTEIVGRLNNRSLYPSEGAHASRPRGHTSDYWAMQIVLPSPPKAVLAFPATRTQDTGQVASADGRLSFAFGGGSTSREETGTGTS